ncbi:class I SAM-dependent methyltransferase [Desulfoluna butyratoxydans]|nr:class I SAM-dependent methyltransferase [Desulfoluna butyratoxydans]
MTMIYDNDAFFEQYKRLRLEDTGLNGKMEEPCMRPMLGDVSGLRVLDIGAGFGHQAAWLKEHNAQAVVALDPSANMFAHATARHAGKGITFVHGYYEDQVFDDPFDLIVSSMALHYVEDLAPFFAKCHGELVEGGHLVFSMEHPVCTANPTGYSEDGGGKFWRLTDYFREGERVQTWFVDGVRKTHRTLSTVINALIAAGFAIRQVEEPAPMDREYPEGEKTTDYFWIRPSIVVIKAGK